MTCTTSSAIPRSSLWRGIGCGATEGHDPPGWMEWHARSIGVRVSSGS